MLPLLIAAAGAAFIFSALTDKKTGDKAQKVTETKVPLNEPAIAERNDGSGSGGSTGGSDSSNPSEKELTVNEPLE